MINSFRLVFFFRSNEKGSSFFEFVSRNRMEMEMVGWINKWMDERTMMAIWNGWLKRTERHRQQE